MAFTYGLNSENLAPSYAPALSGLTEVSGFEKGNLSNGNPASYASFTQSTGSLVYNFSSARTVGFWAFFNHSLKNGSNILRVQANATDVWTSPSYSKWATIPTILSDMTANFFVDTSDASAYQYWRVNIDSTQDVAIKIGELFIAGTLRAFPYDVNWGIKYGFKRKHISHETDYGVRMAYDIGTTIRWIEAEMETTDAGWTLYETLWRDARGPVRPFVIVPNPSANDPMFVRFRSEEMLQEWAFLNYHKVPIEFEEVSSGIQVRP